MINFNDILKPCILLYPFSPMLTSTSPKNIHEWRIYRVYIMIACIAVNGTIIAHIYFYTFVKKQRWTIVNRPCSFTMTTVYFTMMAIESMRLAKKNKIKKLMDEINELSDAEFKINDWKCKIYVAIFTVSLLFVQVFSSVLSLFHSNFTHKYSMAIAFINLMTDSEILLFACCATVFDWKLKAFVALLEDIAKKRERGHYELYERFRQTMYVLKKINNVWKHQMLLIIGFEMFFSTITVLKLLVKKQDFSHFVSISSALSKYMLMLRHFLIYVQIGMLGQGVSQRLRQVTVLAGSLRDMDLGEELNHQTWQIAQLAAVCPGRLQVASFPMDGQLPLRAASAIISAVILVMQFGISVD